MVICNHLPPHVGTLEFYWWDWFVPVGITTCDGWQWETPEFQTAWNLPLSGPSCQSWRVGTVPACTLIGEASLITSKAVLGPLETIQKVEVPPSSL